MKLCIILCIFFSVFLASMHYHCFIEALMHLLP
nr:MAG TPA: hypothetical protein [Caudoviricetes sp.]